MSKYLNLPSFLILSFIIRLLIVGAGIGEALVAIALSGLYGFYYYLESKKEPIANKDLLERLLALEDQIKTTREKVNSITLASHLKR